MLFDRVVVPVPETEFGKLAGEELAQLDAEVAWLEKRGMGRRFPWDPERFEEWRGRFVAAAAARELEEEPENRRTRDAELDTRYELVQAVKDGVLTIPESPRVKPVAVPVFGQSEELGDLPFERVGGPREEQAAFELVLDEMPLPAQDAPLEHIARLREKRVFRSAMTKMRAWQTDVALQLMEAQENPAKRELILDRARLQLVDWIASFRTAMEEAELAKARGIVKTVASIGQALVSPMEDLVGLAGDVADNVSMRTTEELCWKSVYREEFALAGVVCLSERALHGKPV